MRDLRSGREGAAEQLLQTNSPRHIDLARELLAEIGRGIPPVGALLPTEAEICDSTGLSRYAVRQAIQKLCELGVVERRAGIGTRVLASEPTARFTQVMDTLNDLTRYAKTTVFRPDVRETVAIDDAPMELRAASGVRAWYHIHGPRFGSGDEAEPIALVDIYLDKAFAGAAGVKTLTDQPIHKLVEAHYQIKFTKVDQVIEGVLIEEPEAARLGVAPGSAGLRIIRSYYAGERLIEVTFGLHPASRFSYSMSFELAARCSPSAPMAQN